MRVPSGRSAAASWPLIALRSFRSTAMGHGSCAMGVRSCQQSVKDPHTSLITVASTGCEGCGNETPRGRDMHASQVEQAVRTAEPFVGLAQPRLAPPQSGGRTIVAKDYSVGIASVHTDGKALQQKAVIEIVGQRGWDI